MKQFAKFRETSIGFLDEGVGHPVVLVHGFASNAEVNWLWPGWIKALNKAGYRAIAIDNRGHGESTKFLSEEDYHLDKMAGDVLNLIAYLELKTPDVMGYSMGSRITATLANRHGGRLGNIILAGNGYNMIEGGFDSTAIRDGLLAASFEQAPTTIGRDFRFFADQTGSNLEALAACIMAARTHIPESVFESIKNRTLVIAGTEDTVADNPAQLATIIPDGHFEPIPNRNHMNAVGDKVYKEKVLEFLTG
ncbi:MAG: alpha/beta fold hydrolase [Rhizobiaceae bacterium]